MNIALQIAIEAKVKFITFMRKYNPNNPEIQEMIREIGHEIKLAGNIV